MKSFPFQLSDEDFDRLQTLQENGYSISINLDPSLGGLPIVRDWSSWIEWLFISEIESANGESYDDHRAALDGLIGAYRRPYQP